MSCITEWRISSPRISLSFSRCLKKENKQKIPGKLYLLLFCLFCLPCKNRKQKKKDKQIFAKIQSGKNETQWLGEHYNICLSNVNYPKLPQSQRFSFLFLFKQNWATKTVPKKPQLEENKETKPLWPGYMKLMYQGKSFQKPFTLNIVLLYLLSAVASLARQMAEFCLTSLLNLSLVACLRRISTTPLTPARCSLTSSVERNSMWNFCAIFLTPF